VPAWEAVCEAWRAADLAAGEEGERTAKLNHFNVYFPGGKVEACTTLPDKARLLKTMYFLLFAVTPESPCLSKVGAATPVVGWAPSGRTAPGRVGEQAKVYS
jgi:hypothetical protein